MLKPDLMSQPSFQNKAPFTLFGMDSKDVQKLLR